MDGNSRFPPHSLQRIHTKTGRPIPLSVGLPVEFRSANRKSQIYWLRAPSEGLKLNFCPPIDASNIKPPLGLANTATPFSKRACADAPDVTATADALAANSSLLPLNLFKAASFSKTITSE